MFLVIIKFIEVITRAGFVIGATYALDLRAAGQFGIIVTLTGLFSFALGFERHVDIQRRLVGEPSHVFDRAYQDALALFAANYALLLPVYALCVLVWAKATLWQTALCLLIVIAEQLSNQVYQLSLVNNRFRTTNFIIVARNVVLVAVLLAAIVLGRDLFSLDFVLAAWGATAGALIVALGLIWVRISNPGAAAPPRSLTALLARQYRASRHHFLIGLLAILMLQGDRLLVGALLPLSDVGVYFRHVLLVSIAYQVFNIGFFNRVLPTVFARAKTEARAALEAIVRREFLVLTGLVLCGLAAMIAFDRLGGRFLLERFAVDLVLVAVLMAGVVVRVAADFNGMILNARLNEAAVLQAQLVSFVAGALLLAWLTWQFHIYGAAAATVAAATVYFALSFISLRALPAYPQTVSESSGP